MSSSKTRAVRLHSITFEAAGVLSFAFRALGDEVLPDFTPGAHIDIHLPQGLVRQYSLTNASDGRSYVVAVARDRASRGGSLWLHDQARVGEIFQVSEPRNHFELDAAAPEAVLLAGGIGVTPILAMARQLQASGQPWRLHYAVRDRASAAFVEALAQLGGQVELHVDDEAGGLIDVARVVGEAPAGAHLYCCGPAPMIAAFQAAAGDRDPAGVHVEHFGAAPIAAGGEGFQVELVRSGRVLTVPADRSILDVVLEAGVDAPSSCRNGVCGSCETRVLEGAVEHHDMILSEAERASGDTMMICCSRASGPRLRLDL